MGNVTVSISLPDNLLHEIDRVARGESRSRSELVREAARAYIRRKERWAGILALGQDVAKRKALKPEDVSNEIAADRRHKRRDCRGYAKRLC